MLSLLLRNLFYTILQPGLVAGLIPYLILSNVNNTWETPRLLLFQMVGSLLILMGAAIAIHCIYNFAKLGKGTLSPADPTQELVVEGLYSYSRNPMYVGMLSIVLGYSLYFQSFSLLAYSLLLFVGFHLFVVFVEEPRLRRDFGGDYLTYCDNVGRWV